jgi:5-methylcytosine-specific restriction endonuclease McrA
MTYSEKLKDPRWQKKRLEVLERAGWACEDCGTDTKQLEVHHPLYLKGREPWEYNKSLMCLCSDCHEGRGKAEKDIKIMTAAMVRQMTPDEVADYHEDLFQKTRGFFGL